MQNLQWPKTENIQAVETRARHEVVRLEAGLVVLEVVVGIAPLLGLLGAVSGLVNVFANFGASSSINDPRGIAKGISEALTTTIVGAGDRDPEPDRVFVFLEEDRDDVRGDRVADFRAAGEMLLPEVARPRCRGRRPDEVEELL